MKTLFLVLMSALAVTSFGQSATGLTVTGQNWQVTRDAPRADLSIPVEAPDQQQQDWLLHTKINEERARRGLPPIPPPAGRSSPRSAMGSKRNIYVYEARVRNEGEKTVRAVTWEYVFYETGTKRELGRQKFTSKKIIRPGKEKKLIERSAFPPTNVINAGALGDQPTDQYAEEVIILDVEYKDS